MSAFDPSATSADKFAVMLGKDRRELTGEGRNFFADIRVASFRAKKEAAYGRPQRRLLLLFD